MRSAIIARRFRGPPDSANGGYACGLLAKHGAGAHRVRLHAPPPVDVPVSITLDGAGQLLMKRDERLIATGAAAEPHGDVPAPVSLEAASDAAGRYRWSARHPFPGCFVCGPERDPGDGLRIFPGAVAGREVVAAPWTPDDSVCDARGLVLPEVVWAALDCPSWFGLLEFEPGTTVGLLGQLTARVLRRPAAGEPCVAMGWARGREGRKLHAGAALFGSDGTLVGSSLATWIEPR